MVFDVRRVLFVSLSLSVVCFAVVDLCCLLLRVGRVLCVVCCLTVVCIVSVAFFVGCYS